MRIWISIACWLLSTLAYASPSVRVLALFPNKAMLEIDGERKVLSVGMTDMTGVTLVSATPAGAVVEIEGKRESLVLGSAVAATYAKPSRRETRLIKDTRRDGYFIDGLINGQPVRFLVDTGATSVAMSEAHAARLGIAHRVDGRRVGVGTASGSAIGHQVNLRSLSVGGLRLNDVRAVVIDGDGPGPILLGMNVLSQFELEQRENLLILRSRF